jgi:pimeloyl-ACP methyl ester carboxylesterase
VLDRLATRYEVIAVDLPGFGASPVPAGGMPKDMAGYVDVLARFFATAGLDHPHVAGYSLGGGMALELAAAGRVRSATAISPVGFFNRAERRRAVVILRTMRTTSFLPTRMIHSLLRLSVVRRIAYAPIVAYPSRIDPILAAEDALALRRGRGFNSAVRASRSYQYHGRPTVPVAVAWGTRDRLLLPCQADRARALLPDARHVALPGCGHVPMTDNPDLVATLIEQTTSAAPNGSGEISR